MSGNEQLAALFREEAAEHLAELETTLLELEQSPSDPELIARAFRSLHTLKGSGAMAGFVAIAELAHEVESVFAQIRQGKFAASADLVRLTLGAKDLFRAMLDPQATVASDAHERLLRAFRDILDIGLAKTQAEAPQPKALANESGEAMRTIRIDWRLHRDFFQNGSNPLGILAELRGMGLCQVTTGVDAIPRLEDLEPETCHLGFGIVLQADKSENDVRDVFIFVEDRADLRITIAENGASGSSVEEPKPALPHKDLAPSRVSRLFETQEMAAVPSEARKPDVTSNKDLEMGSSIRVPAQKLDSLVDLVGELVIAQARLAELAFNRSDDQLFSIAEDIGRLSAELRDNTLDIRMVPIGTTFVRFRRLVHDLASELNKAIRLETDGADTELDKTVIERLFDPLVHLIRNCCDHGIEPPDVRRQGGKNPTGTVRLVAYHSGQSVFVEIRDDGAGIDPDAIRCKAVALALCSEADAAAMSVSDLHKLIFLPGFSTAKAISNVSGRGVGMDVVKRSVEALRGEIAITSELGVGTTIRLQLPLTLAIIEGLLVVVGEDKYVLPMSLVEECIEITAGDIERSHGNHLANVRGELVPYLRLRDWFASAGRRPSIEQIAITTAEGKRFGFVVDSVIGQHQTVIKSLGRIYQNVRGLSGATILGDGSLALIVDVPALLASIRQAA